MEYLDERPGIELHPVMPPGEPREPGEHERPVPAPVEVPPLPGSHPNADPIEVPTQPRMPAPMRRRPDPRAKRRELRHSGRAMR
jgi:hypothetical protein